MADDLTEAVAQGYSNRKMVILANPDGTAVSASGQSTDANLVQTNGVTSATATQWTEVLPASATRNGASIQNRDVANQLFVVQAANAPANGSQPGEIAIAVAPTLYRFDFIPKKRYFIRGVAASQAYALNVW